MDAFSCGRRAAAALFALLAAAAAKGQTAPKPGKPPVKPAPNSAGLLLFNDAIRAAAAGQYAQAEALYRRLLGIEPKNAGAWGNLGLVLAQQKRNDEALLALRQASNLEPTAAPFLAQIAVLELKLARYDAALIDARRARTINPREPAALAVEASVLTGQRRWTEAIAPLTSLNSLRGGRDFKTSQSLVYALSMSGRRKDALAVARTMAQRFPRDSDAHLLRGDLSGQLGYDLKDKALLAEARAAYTKAFALAPRSARAGVNAALAAEMAGAPDEARALLERVIKASPDEAAAHYALGRLQLTAARLTQPQRVELARKSFETAVALAPRNSEYATSLGYLLLLQSTPEYDKAANLFRAALSVDATNLRAHRGLVDALWKGNRQAEAVRAQTELVGRIPEEVEAARRLAQMLRVTGRKDESYAVLRGLAARRPADIQPLRDLAQWQVDDGRPADAAATLSAALVRKPRDPMLLTALGDVLERAGKQDEAAARFTEAIALKPDLEDAHMALSALRESQKKPDEAKLVRRRWLETNPASNQARWAVAQDAIEAGRDDEALTLMRSITLRKDDPSRMLYRLGPIGLLEKRGKREEAITELRRLLAEEKEEVLQYRLVDNLVALGKTDEAEVILRELRRTGKDPARPYLVLASIDEKAGKLDEAARELEDLIQLQPQTSAAIEGLWRIRAAQGKPEAAPAFVERVALAETGNPNAALIGALDRQYRGANQWDRFLAFTERAAKAYPDSRLALGVRAQALLRDTPGEAARTEAATLYGRLAMLTLGDPDPPYQQGRQMEALGKKPEAIAAYTESARRKRGGPADAALKALGAPLPPENKPEKAPTPPPSKSTP